MSGPTSTTGFGGIDLTAIDTSAVQPLIGGAGSPGGGEFIYLQGCASTVIGSWVTYKEDGSTTLLTAGAVGPVAIALATINSTSKYGWYLISGTYSAALSGTISAYKPLYIDTVAGQVAGFRIPAINVGDLVYNAWSTAANNGGNLAVRVNRPYVAGL